MTHPMSIRVYGTVPDSIVDGPGLRYAIFVQGCSHECPGCHNPESHPACGGTVTPIETLLQEIEANGLVRGVTFSGGDPFEQAASCAALAHKLKDRGYNIWTYTGYLYEDLRRIASQGSEGSEAHPLLDAQGVRDLLYYTDVLVDGPFVSSLRSLSLKWCGSSNQRLINLEAMRRCNDLDTIVLWHPDTFDFAVPDNW